MEAKNSLWPEHRPMPFPQQVHLTDYLNIVRRRKWVVIIFFLTVVSLVTAASFLSTPIYKATTQIIIERQLSPVIPMGEIAPDDPRQQDYYQTQYNLLRSRSLAYKVIEDLELWKDFQFSRTKNAHASISAPAEPTAPKDKEASRSQIEPAFVDWYLSNLQVTPIGGSQLVDVSFLGPLPESITRIVKTHVDAFIEKNIQTQKSAAQQALDWLKTQLQEQKAKVEASQRAIYEYKKANNITSLEKRENIVSQKLMEWNSRLTKAKAERMAKEAIYSQLEDFSVNRESLFSLPEISQDSVIQNLRTQLVQLKAKRFEMGTKFGPKHPRLIELNSTIKQLEQEIRGEVQRLRKAIKAELDRASVLEKLFQESLDTHKKLAMSLTEKAINYDVLQQQAESDQHIYDILLKQAKEIGLTSVMESSNVRIVDEAEVPRFPIKPRTFLNILLAVVLGLFMGTGLAFFFEYMDNTVKTPEDVPLRLGMPVLGVLPYDKSLKGRSTPALPCDDDPGAKDKPPLAYPLYDLSSRFPASLQSMDQSVSGHVLVVGSATMGEGKTTVLGSLAINLANAGLRVLMVDCDFQRPALHDLFGTKNGGGLARAIAQVLSHVIGTGKLSECSLDDLFFLIALKKRSGQLDITNDAQTMSAVFQDGQLLHIQNQNNPLANRLGAMLLRGGFITKSQLDEAMERHERTGQPLGYILINAGFITQDKLQGPLRLQMEENLQKLFSWKQGAFVFKPGRIRMYENERIHFGEDYSQTIRRLGHLAGSRLLESEILSHVKSAREGQVYVLPAGMAPSKWNGQVNLALLAKFLDILKWHFDVLLVDAPPLLDAAGAAPLCALADGVIFVVKAGHLSIKGLNQAKTGLSEAKAKIIGAILNEVKIGQNYYYPSR